MVPTKPTHACSEMGVGLAAFRGHMLPVWDVAAGPLGYHFASASADRTARVWATDHIRTLRIFAGVCRKWGESDGCQC